MNRAIGLISILGAFAVGACTAGDDGIGSDDNELNESSTPRDGSTIDSPSVDKTKKYWGGRSIDFLARAGLATDRIALAQRADGILANNPPNRRLGVDELAALEKRADTLFPEEKALLPKLWDLLLITPAPEVKAPAASLANKTVDKYPVASTELPLDKLAEAEQKIAARIQLTQNSDGDDQTISGHDIEAAFDDRGAYLSQEVKAFRAIALKIAQGTDPTTARLPADAQRIELTQGDGAVLKDDATLQIAIGVSGTVQSGWQFARATTDVNFIVTETMTATPKDETVSLIALDLETGADNLAQKMTTMTIKTPSRVEVWQGGERVGELDAVIDPNTASAAQPIPFGYSVVNGDQVSHMSFGRQRTGTYGPNVASAPTVPSGSYYIGGTKDRLDVFANGRALYVQGGLAHNCYPSSSSTSVNSCRAIDRANNQTLGDFVFQSPTDIADSPAPIYGTVAGARVVLYPN